eukprot:5471282-Amphidinium_carterae.1
MIKHVSKQEVKRFRYVKCVNAWPNETTQPIWRPSDGYLINLSVRKRHREGSVEAHEQIFLSFLNPWSLRFPVERRSNRKAILRGILLAGPQH